MDKIATERPRIWIPKSEVESRFTLAVELPPDMERPTKGEHYDMMEGTIMNLLDMNNDAEIKRAIETYVFEAPDLLVWAEPGLNLDRLARKMQSYAASA